MNAKDNDNIIRYLRGLVDNLESGIAVLVEFSQEIEIVETIGEMGITGKEPTGGRIETIRWRPRGPAA